MNGDMLHGEQLELIGTVVVIHEAADIDCLTSEGFFGNQLTFFIIENGCAYHDGLSAHLTGDGNCALGVAFLRGIHALDLEILHKNRGVERKVSPIVFDGLFFRCYGNLAVKCVDVGFYKRDRVALGEELDVSGVIRLTGLVFQARYLIYTAAFPIGNHADDAELVSCYQKLMTGRYNGDESKKDIHEKDKNYPTDYNFPVKFL